MEQQSGAAGSAQAQAARTILPGEPFDPPAASQVPGPRPAGQAPVPAEAPEALLPPPAWNYQPMAAPESAPLYQPMAAPESAPVYQSLPATHAEPQPFGGDFDTLHDFASLPAAQQLGAPAPATDFPAAFAPAAYQPSPAAYPPPPADAPVFAPAPVAGAYPPPPVFAPSEDALPPLPPFQEDEGLLGEPDKKGGGRKSPDKRLLAVALVAVLAGGGYFGYTQLNKKSSSTTANTPIAPVTAPVVQYQFPSNVAGFKLQPASATFSSVRLAVAKQWSPVAARSMTAASYSAGHPYIIAMAFHPAAAQLASDYASLVHFTATPSRGSVEVASHVAVPGAAGGQMTCGGEQGATSLSWCVWQGTNTVGMLQIEGTPKTQITEIVTRELRAYAEH